MPICFWIMVRVGPVHEGKTIHQFNHKWTRPEYTASKRNGLKRESKKKIYAGMYGKIHESFRLVFRSITSPTNMRTVISTIIPPHTFHTQSLRSVVFSLGGMIELSDRYNKKISYFCGVFNSMTFDFMARTIVQLDLPPVIKSLPIPNPIYEDMISNLAAKLIAGDPEFEEFAESIGVDNVKLTPAQRIETTARLDALVGHSYGMTEEEYKIILESFKFKSNPKLHEMEEVIWDNRNMREFYGEVRKLALPYFQETAAQNPQRAHKPAGGES